MIHNLLSFFPHVAEMLVSEWAGRHTVQESRKRTVMEFLAPSGIKCEHESSPLNSGIHSIRFLLVLLIITQMFCLYFDDIGSDTCSVQHINSVLQSRRGTARHQWADTAAGQSSSMWNRHLHHCKTSVFCFSHIELILNITCLSLSSGVYGFNFLAFVSCLK